MGVGGAIANYVVAVSLEKVLCFEMAVAEQFHPALHVWPARSVTGSLTDRRCCIICEALELVVGIVHCGENVDQFDKA